MKKNTKYRFGSFLYRFNKYLPKVYYFLAPKKSLIGAVYDSFIKYYLDNQENIVKEVKFKRTKSTEQIEPEVIKE